VLLFSATSSPAALRRAHHPAASSGAIAAEADLLRQAYGILASGDHDYKGHRVKAMKATEAAAKKLGVNLHGDGKGHEPQALSDAQLRNAQSLLQQLRSSVSGRGQKKVVKHVDHAIKEISIALSIR
jgi:hypothetical protein